MSHGINRIIIKLTTGKITLLGHTFADERLGRVENGFLPSTFAKIPIESTFKLDILNGKLTAVGSVT